jgi:CelD/BcsL family acetyltransferase involved in cellulose biosynthesis
MFTTQSPDELRDLEPSWRDFAERRRNAFLTPEWFHSWSRYYGGHATSLVAGVRYPDGTLKGLLPLSLQPGRTGVAQFAGGNLGDFFLPVCEAGDEEEVAAAAGAALADTEDRWGILALRNVDRERPWIESLAEATGVRLKARERVAGELWKMRLTEHADWEAYLGSRSSHMRAQIRRLRRRAAKKHSLRIRRSEDPASVKRDMQTLFELHDRRFGASSSLRGESVRAFHTDFAVAALERGWLRLWFLELDEQPAAAWYGWRFGDCYSFYNGGFDPHWNDARPGFVLISAVIEAAFEEGAEQFDFLLGNEPYKARFAEETRQVSEVILSRAFPHPAAAVTWAELSAFRIGRSLPAGPRERLYALASRSKVRGGRR